MKKKINIQNDLNSRKKIAQNRILQTEPIIPQEQETINEISDAESQNLQRTAPDTISEEPKKGKRKAKGDI